MSFGIMHSLWMSACCFTVSLILLQASASHSAETPSPSIVPLQRSHHPPLSPVQQQNKHSIPSSSKPATLRHTQASSKDDDDKATSRSKRELTDALGGRQWMEKRLRSFVGKRDSGVEILPDEDVQEYHSNDNYQSVEPISILVERYIHNDDNDDAGDDDLSSGINDEEIDLLADPGFYVADFHPPRSPNMKVDARNEDLSQLINNDGIDLSADPGFYLPEFFPPRSINMNSDVVQDVVHRPLRTVSDDYRLPFMDITKSNDRLAKRMRNFVGKRMRSFVGKRDNEVSQYDDIPELHKRLRHFVGKRMRHFVGKRLRSFVGKRSGDHFPAFQQDYNINLDDDFNKRMRNFVGKRSINDDFIETQKRLRSFIGKRSEGGDANLDDNPSENEVDYPIMREFVTSLRDSRLRPFVGKTSLHNSDMIQPSKRIRDFVGKRDSRFVKRLRSFVGRR